MKVTAQIIEKIRQGMKARGLNQTQLAERIGVHRSYISRLLRGDYPTIPDDQGFAISDALESVLMPLRYEKGEVTHTAIQLTKMAEDDPKFSNVLEALIQFRYRALLPKLTYEGEQMVGEHLAKIVTEEMAQKKPNYNKIGAEALEFLRDFYICVDPYGI